MEIVFWAFVKIPLRCKNTEGDKLELAEAAKIATILKNKLVIYIECLGMVEATRIFTLPNLFLVWKAKKNLVKCDLVLVLTEYYKKRIESRLKNRKTYMNENNSTVPIVLSKPNLLIPSD